VLLLLQGVLSKLGAAKELMKEVLAREKKKQEERAAAKDKDVYVSPSSSRHPAVAVAPSWLSCPAGSCYF
jgi:hypothetical protein